MSVLQKLRDLFRRPAPTAEELEGAAEAHRIRDDMETARLSQRSTAAENYQSGRGSRQ